MKRIDFEHGTVTGNIFGAALPMLVAQILSLLYNIVDRVYIARIPEVGTAALGAVGLCFPLIVIITAFSNLFGSGGAPLFSIERGKNDQKKAERIMNTSYSMVCVCAVILMVIGFLFARPLLSLFGASADAMVYAYPYMMIYLIGTLPSMVATGMNSFKNLLHSVRKFMLLFRTMLLNSRYHRKVRKFKDFIQNRQRVFIQQYFIILQEINIIKLIAALLVFARQPAFQFFQCLL